MNYLATSEVFPSDCCSGRLVLVAQLFLDLDFLIEGEKLQRSSVLKLFVNSRPFIVLFVLSVRLDRRASSFHSLDLMRGDYELFRQNSNIFIFSFAISFEIPFEVSMIQLPFLIFLKAHFLLNIARYGLCDLTIGGRACPSTQGIRGSFGHIG